MFVYQRVPKKTNIIISTYPCLSLANDKVLNHPKRVVCSALGGGSFPEIPRKIPAYWERIVQQHGESTNMRRYSGNSNLNQTDLHILKLIRTIYIYNYMILYIILYYIRLYYIIWYYILYDIILYDFIYYIIFYIIWFYILYDILYYIILYIILYFIYYIIILYYIIL